MKQLALLLLIAASPSSRAEEPCKDIDPILDSDGSSCSSQELAKADDELNAQYKKLLAQLDSDAKINPAATQAKKELIEAQRQWVKFRDADCGAVFTYYLDGTVRVSAEQSCELSRTRQRTEQLEHLFDGT